MILVKLPSAADPRTDAFAVLPTALQLAGTARLQNAVARQYAANPPVDRFGRSLNPSAEQFPYYVDAAVVRGLRAIARRNGPFVR